MENNYKEDEFLRLENLNKLSEKFMGTFIEGWENLLEDSEL